VVLRIEEPRSDREEPRVPRPRLTRVELEEAGMTLKGIVPLEREGVEIVWRRRGWWVCEREMGSGALVPREMGKWCVGADDLAG